MPHFPMLVLPNARSNRRNARIGTRDPARKWGDLDITNIFDYL